MFFRVVMCRFRRLLRSDFFLFSSVWIFGIVIGICLADAYAFSAGAVASALIAVRPSPIATLLITMLPVLMIGVSLWKASSIVCFATIAIDAVCRGYCSFMTFLSFGSAAWLVRGLVLFSGACTSVLMWWLLLRRGGTDPRRFKKDMVICILSAILISAVDILGISPFLSELAMYI